MQRISLSGTWQLSYGPQAPGRPAEPEELPSLNLPTIPAQVPGNVELDLHAAGAAPDPYAGLNVLDLQACETFQWFYRRSFASPPLGDDERVDLVFDGLDCLGTIWLNGHRVGGTANMLVPHRFDVTPWLRADAENDLLVRIASSVLAGRAREPEPVEWAQNIHYEALGIRKPPHMYGWDIMPRLVSAGLWRDVRLEVLPATRWRSVYWATARVEAARREATVLADWDFATGRADLSGLRVRIRLERDGRVAHASEQPALGTHGRAGIELRDASLWWPRGAGEPALYDAVTELVDAGGRVLDTHRCRVGLRTVRLERTDVTTPERPGEFVFVVNGRKVFARGTNWVPLNGLHSRDGEHLPATFAMVTDLNCNMVRCWGGNVYESDAFFDLADEAGVMVWQDFALACCVYPQTDAFAAAMRQEAEAVVTRLRNHPSLVLWAGNNENDEASEWSQRGRDPNEDRISRQVLPDVVRRLDPHRAYLPSSPYRAPALVALSRLECQPEQHLWGPRGDYKSPYYAQTLAHFASEIGYHGCPGVESLRAMFGGEVPWPPEDDEAWRFHGGKPCRGFEAWDYRIALMSRQITCLFGQAPDMLADYVLASQVVQAEALKFFIEDFRQAKWRRTGLLWWNLRDGWPIVSDAIVDYYGRRKLAYGYVRRAQQDVCAIVREPHGGRHEIVVVNDLPHDVAGVLAIDEAHGDRPLLSTEFAVAADGLAVVGELPPAPQPALWRLRWELVGGVPAGWSHYLAGPRPVPLETYRRWLPLSPA